LGYGLGGALQRAQIDVRLSRAYARRSTSGERRAEVREKRDWARVGMCAECGAGGARGRGGSGPKVVPVV